MSCNSGIDFFPWSQDEMRVEKWQDIKRFPRLSHTLAAPRGRIKCASRPSWLLANSKLQLAKVKKYSWQGEVSGVRGSRRRFVTPHFWWNRGGILVGGLKDISLSEKNGCHDHMSANSKVLSFLGPFLGHWELQTAKRPFFGRNRWL